jgi:hypothetical protein
MRVGTANINVVDLINKIKHCAAMGRRMRVPNCTHVNMDRVFGRDQQCFVCGRSPSIGFLYECRQDSDTESLHDLLARHAHKFEPVKSDMRRELECIGLSESIILTAESGHYTNAQLAKLKVLKRELRQTIRDTRQPSQANDVMSRLAAMAKAPSNTDSAFNSITATETVSGLEQRTFPSNRRSLTSNTISFPLKFHRSPQDALSELATPAAHTTKTACTSLSRPFSPPTFRP